MDWLVGGEAYRSKQAEQGLGDGLGKIDEREFCCVERKVTGENGRWRFVCTQDVGRWRFDGRCVLRKVNCREKDVGKEVDTCVQSVEAFGNGVDNEVAGVELAQEVCEHFESEESSECNEKVGSVKGGQAQYIGSQVAPVMVGRKESVKIDIQVIEQEVATLEEEH